MTPSAILSRAKSLGLTISPDGENLRIRGPHDAIEEITPLLKAHKPAILAAMNMPLNEAENSFSSLKADMQGKGGHPLTLSPQSPSTLDLDSLIQQAAIFYLYSPEDFILIEEMKRTDPDGLRLALETDLLRPFYMESK